MTERCCASRRSRVGRYRSSMAIGCWRLRKLMSYGPKPSIIPVSTSGLIDLLVTYLPDFNIAATVLLSRIEKYLALWLLIWTARKSAEEFAMMIGMGFFVLTGDRYQMVIPNTVDPRKSYERGSHWQRPKTRIQPASRTLYRHDVPHAEAKAWQSRLRGMDETYRQADRALLLGIDPAPSSAMTSWNCS